MQPINNYLRLEPNLASSGQPTEAQLRWIAEEGFKVVINLGLSDGEYALQNEGDLVLQLGMQYFHIPVIWDAPQRSEFLTFMTVMAAHRESWIFVHCAANMRASVFIALYRILRLNWDPDLAMEWVYLVWDPNPIWQAFMDECLASC